MRYLDRDKLPPAFTAMLSAIRERLITPDGVFGGMSHHIDMDALEHGVWIVRIYPYPILVEEEYSVEAVPDTPSAPATSELEKLDRLVEDVLGDDLSDAEDSLTDADLDRLVEASQHDPDLAEILAEKLSEIEGIEQSLWAPAFRLNLQGLLETLEDVEEFTYQANDNSPDQIPGDHIKVRGKYYGQPVTLYIHSYYPPEELPTMVVHADGEVHALEHPDEACRTSDNAVAVDEPGMAPAPAAGRGRRPPAEPA